MIAAGLLIVALVGQPQPRTYTWRDSAGQTHITNTPPPADAVILEPPPPPAVGPGQPDQSESARRNTGRADHRPVWLNPPQQKAWQALDQRLAQARAQGDRPAIEAVTDALIQDSLWGQGLWALPAAPLLAVALMGLLGWWLALGLRAGARLPVLAGFTLLGLVLGHLLLHAFLYHRQALRLRQNLELLEQHLGTGQSMRPEYRALLQQRYQALDQAAAPTQPPWRFPAEVEVLRRAMRQVMVEP